MRPEIEVKFCNVSHDALRSRLEALGATCKMPVRSMRRQNFDFADKRLDKRNGWVRVRDEADKVTMSYKQLNGRELSGMHEVNLTVDSFDNAVSFLEQISLVPKAFQETRRESWQLDGCEVELDEWPWIKPFVEIEGPDEASVRAVAGKLGLEWPAAMFGSVEVAYQAEFDVTDSEINYLPVVTFDEPVPEWLEARRRAVGEAGHRARSAA